MGTAEESPPTTTARPLYFNTDTALDVCADYCGLHIDHAGPCAER